MRILLIKPYWPYPYSKGDHTYNRIWPPLSLANCAGLLEADRHQATILDAHAGRIKPQQISSYIKGYNKIFITSSSLDRWQCPNLDITPFLNTASEITKLSKEVYLIGYHGSINPTQMLNNTGAKAVIRNEPEFIVREIYQNKPLHAIKGITYKKGGKIISNADHENFDITKLLKPSFHLLDMNKYFYEVLGDRFSLFEMGRGCRFSCTFCNQLMYGPKLRTKSKEQVISELQSAIEEHGVRSGYFMDLEFLGHQKRAEEICDFLIDKKYNFKWCCQTRADSLNASILKKMKMAGCQLIHIGVESGQQKYLDMTKKRLQKSQIIGAVKLCRQLGIKTLAFYIFGFKGETDRDREETFEFAKKLNTSFASFHKVYSYNTEGLYFNNIKEDRKLTHFLRKVFLKYYLRFDYLKSLELSTLRRGLHIFFERLKTI